MEQGGDYFIPFPMHLFQPDDEDSPSRDGRLISDGDSELIRAAAKLAMAEHHRG